MRDLRKYSRQTNLRLFIGGVLLTYIIGIGLIYLIYGQNAAVMGLLCLTGGLLPIVLIALTLKILDWIVKRADEE